MNMICIQMELGCKNTPSNGKTWSEPIEIRFKLSCYFPPIVSVCTQWSFTVKIFIFEIAKKCFYQKKESSVLLHFLLQNIIMIKQWFILYKHRKIFFSNEKKIYSMMPLICSKISSSLIGSVYYLVYGPSLNISVALSKEEKKKILYILYILIIIKS